MYSLVRHLSFSDKGMLKGGTSKVDDRQQPAYPAYAIQVARLFPSSRDNGLEACQLCTLGEAEPEQKQWHHLGRR